MKLRNINREVISLIFEARIRDYAFIIVLGAVGVILCAGIRSVSVGDMSPFSVCYMSVSGGNIKNMPL